MMCGMLQNGVSGRGLVKKHETTWVVTWEQLKVNDDYMRVLYAY